MESTWAFFISWAYGEAVHNQLNDYGWPWQNDWYNRPVPVVNGTATGHCDMSNGTAMCVYDGAVAAPYGTLCRGGTLICDGGGDCTGSYFVLSLFFLLCLFCCFCSHFSALMYCSYYCCVSSLPCVLLFFLFLVLFALLLFFCLIVSFGHDLVVLCVDICFVCVHVVIVSASLFCACLCLRHCLLCALCFYLTLCTFVYFVYLYVCSYVC